MIDIVRFRELLLEIREEVNEQSEYKISECVLAVKEEHMTKKLKDKEGIILCANYPDAETSFFSSDNREDSNHVFFFICEKVPSGSQDNEEELLHYARLQRIMKIMREVIVSDVFCDKLIVKDKMRTEWEYSIFGGFDGLSLGLIVTDHD